MGGGGEVERDGGEEVAEREGRGIRMNHGDFPWEKSFTLLQHRVGGHSLRGRALEESVCVGRSIDAHRGF